MAFTEGVSEVVSVQVSCCCILRFKKSGNVIEERSSCPVYNVLCCPLQASLGGRVRLMLTGAAPISPTVLSFLRAALGCQVKHTHTQVEFS